MRLPFLKYRPTAEPYPNPAALDVERDGAQADRNTVNRHHTPELPPKPVKFQTLIGINSSHILRVASTVLRPAPNEGIYKRTIEEEVKAKFQYTVSVYVVNIGGMLQIVIGAALTALGAANGPSAAVTILGALNTVIAGLLTYLKGQGLPMRQE